MYRVKRIIEKGFIAVDEETNEEVSFRSPLPFKPGDQVVRTNDLYGFAMVNKLNSLLAHQVLKNSPEGSSEWEEAKKIIIDEYKNPTFLVGDQMLDFLVSRKAGEIIEEEQTS